MSVILRPNELELIEKAMILGIATQKDGLRLCNSHRNLWAKVKEFYHELQEIKTNDSV